MGKKAVLNSVETAVVKASELVKPLGMLLGGIQERAMLPILGHFCVVDNLVYSYNDVVAVGTRIPKPLRGLDVSLPKAVFDVVKGLPSETLLEVNVLGDGTEQGTRVAVRSKRMRLVLPVIRAEKYLFDHKLFEQKMAVEFNASRWRRNLEIASLCVSPNPAVPLFTAAVLMIKDTGKAELFSTDDVTVTRQVLAGKALVDKAMTVVVPYQFCQEVVAVSKEDSVIKFKANKSSVVAVVDGRHYVFSKLMEIKPLPELDKTLQKNISGKLKFTDVTARLRNCMVRAKVMSGGQVVAGNDTAMSLIVREGGKAVFEIVGQHGRLVETMQLKHTQEASLKVDLGLLTRGISLFDQVAITSGNCLVFRDKRETITHLVQAFQG